MPVNPTSASVACGPLRRFAPSSAGYGRRSASPPNSDLAATVGSRDLSMRVSGVLGSALLILAYRS